MRIILLVYCIFVLHSCGSSDPQEVREIKNTKINNFIEINNHTQNCKNNSIGFIMNKGIENHKWVINSSNDVELHGNLEINIGSEITVNFKKIDNKWKIFFLGDDEKNLGGVILMKCIGLSGIINETKKNLYPYEYKK